MNERHLIYEKTYSYEILDHAVREDCGLVYFLAAEWVSVQVPDNMTVVMIYPYDWNMAMTPWKYQGEGMNETGGGAQFAARFMEQIAAPIEAALSHEFCRRLIGGYSLGGLMALYMASEIPQFDGMISVSGSFWYPDALHYFQKKSFPERTKRFYFSLGEKEAKTGNRQRCSVEENTRALCGMVGGFLEMNEGGHFTGIAKRIEKGLIWMNAHETE